MKPARVKTTHAKRRAATPGTAYFLGIDGGGSQTTAWLADNHHHVLARITVGPSNPLKAGLQLARRNLLAASRQARREAGLSSRQKLEAVCAGVAGVGRPSIYRQMLRSLERGVPARRHLLTHDAAIALECALGASPGVIVISGTGSIACGRDENYRIVRCGGWGSVFGDSGSGYDIGRKAVSAALGAFDGRWPETRLGKDICRALKIREITEAVALNLTPDQVAALFPLVSRAARLGDRVAQRLCREAGRELAEMASFLSSRIRGAPARRRVICTGGVFRASPEVRRSFANCLRVASPGARVTLLECQPAEGALALAMASAGNPKLRQIK
ncbi:MAG: N-acetylglucosamine kinase [Terriglobia bacterium]